ncbi:MAG: hypothetical protein IT233_07100 [Bacteroidia bacterium]|nr:hypothetical protein [Bacteroidia bacterium]
MQVKIISWEYIGKEHCLWKGKTDGMLCHVHFFITPTGRDREEYLMRTDTNGIANEICIGLEKAKAKAQELLNTYALSLIIE